MITLSTTELIMTFPVFFIFGFMFRMSISLISLLISCVGNIILCFSDIINQKHTRICDIPQYNIQAFYKVPNYVFAPMTFIFGAIYSVLLFAYLDGVIRIISILLSIVGCLLTGYVIKRVPEKVISASLTIMAHIIFYPLFFIIKTSRGIISRIYKQNTQCKAQ